jgi:hypothetical protein
MATISHDIIPDLYYLSFLSRKSAWTLAEEGMVGGKTIAGIPFFATDTWDKQQINGE